MNKIISIFLMPLLAFAVEPQNRELEKEKPSIDKPKIEKPKLNIRISKYSNTGSTSQIIKE